jgi:hypothetical protein
VALERKQKESKILTKLEEEKSSIMTEDSVDFNAITTKITDQMQQFDDELPKIDISFDETMKNEKLERSSKSLASRQLQIMWGKVEEAKVLNKKLQTAMEQGNKNAPAFRDENEIHEWINHHLTLLESITDAQSSSEDLMKDRGLLTERFFFFFLANANISLISNS